MVVEGCDHFVVWSRMEDLLNLLEETLSVQLSSWDKGILAQKNVLAAQSGVEVLVKQVKWLLISSIQYDLYSVLEINTHLVGLKVVLCFLVEAVLGCSLFALQTENTPVHALVFLGSSWGASRLNSAQTAALSFFHPNRSTIESNRSRVIGVCARHASGARGDCCVLRGLSWSAPNTLTVRCFLPLSHYY